MLLSYVRILRKFLPRVPNKRAANLVQILGFAHLLQTYFVLHNREKETNVLVEFVFTTYLLPKCLFGLHVYSVL